MDAPASSAGLEWLYSTQWFGVKLGLEGAARLLREGLAYPAPGVKVMHVAGTNGKGSVCAIADAVAREAGHRVGLFTSPHLVDFRERIRVEGEPIPAEDLECELLALRGRVAGRDPHPTFFELTLVVAMRHFRARGCDLIILETGMGGRLDATNAVPSDVAVITPVALDHREWLGDTLEQIAAEKAGIIKPGKPVFAAAQEPAARRVIEECACERRAPLTFIEEPLAGYAVALPGRHQLANAALALEALHKLGVRLRVDNVRAGLAAVRWPGRFDHRPEQRLLFDAAHNPQGAELLATLWRDHFGAAQANLLFGAVREKDVGAMLRALRPIAAGLWLCPVASPRALNADELRAAAEGAGFPPAMVSACGDVAAGLARAAASPLTTVVTGSLFLVGEALARIGGQPWRPGSQ
jgi:dihydrofolate synthase / folylpolyglutamate synthase